MGLLVEDLLLLARLDQQRPLDSAPVDLLALAADAVHDARVIAPDRAIDLTGRARGAAPMVLGDEPRLRQVIGNLMSNALVHTPDGDAGRGAIGRSGSAAGRPATGGGRSRSPTDGPGPDPGAGANGSSSASTARTRPAPGRPAAPASGLAIVAALVTAHGGTVTAEPTPGRGATFRIVLPLAPEVVGHDIPSEDRPARRQPQAADGGADGPGARTR